MSTEHTIDSHAGVGNNNLTASKHSALNITTAVLLVLSLGTIDIWCDMLGHCSAMAPASAAVQEMFTNGRVFWSLSLVFCCGFMVLTPHLFDRCKRILTFILPVAASVGTFLYAFSFYGVNSPVLGVAMILLTGICYGWLEMRLLCEVARLERFVDIVWILAASRILKTVIVAILGSYSTEVQIGIDVILPIILGIMLAVLSQRLTKETQINTKTLKPTQVDQTTMLAFLVMYPVLNAVARALSNLGFWGTANVIDGASISASLPASLIFALMVYVTFSQCKDTQVLSRFVRALVLLLGCFLLFDEQTLTVFGTPDAVINILVTAVELFSHYLFWLIAITAIRNLDWDPIRSAAMSELVMSIAALIFGLALQGFSGIGRLIVSAAMYGVIVVALMLLWKMREASLRTSEIDNLEELCQHIAVEYNLSPRETEVFILLAQGRSRTFIQQELIISDATVKSHINHIYQKMGIHSKQDLISLIRK